MLIPGIPDEELEELHWNYGGGRGAAGYRHVPSGITVTRECLPDAPTRHAYEAALAELEHALREQGFLSNGERTDTIIDPGASPDNGGGI
jgi:hypothetical protein